MVVVVVVTHSTTRTLQDNTHPRTASPAKPASQRPDKVITLHFLEVQRHRGIMDVVTNILAIDSFSHLLTDWLTDTHLAQRVSSGAAGHFLRCITFPLWHMCVTHLIRCDSLSSTSCSLDSEGNYSYGTLPTRMKTFTTTNVLGNGSKGEHGEPSRRAARCLASRRHTSRKPWRSDTREPSPEQFVSTLTGRRHEQHVSTTYSNTLMDKLFVFPLRIKWQRSWWQVPATLHCWPDHNSTNCAQIWYIFYTNGQPRDLVTALL